MPAHSEETQVFVRLSDIQTGQIYRVEALGDCYKEIKRHVRGVKNPGSMFGFTFGPDTFEYNLEFAHLEMKVREIPSLLPFDDYLNSLQIKYNGELAYRGRVNRFNAEVQKIEVIRRSTDWLSQIGEFLHRYEES